jgi:c(7)-type cytochrome triheme protein
MTTRSSRLLHGCMVAAALGIATVVAAEPLPRLPADVAFPGGEGSPGTVTFSHRSHVNDEAPDCTVCHPGLFSILGGALAVERPYHEAMDEGRLCGACHTGDAAFGRDDCLACHRTE